MKVFKVTNPKLFNRIICELEDGLANLPWLDCIFGKSETLCDSKDGRKSFTPNYYVGNDEYINLLPDDVNGNYCFFVLHDPNVVMADVDILTRLKTDFSLIVWFDLRTIDNNERDTEAIKANILDVLTRTRLTDGIVEINKVYETAKYVFGDYSIDEVDNQFLMSPFAGFKIEGSMTIKEVCNG